MAVKIRLARIGKKGEPFYRVVAIDSRSKRDGKFLEALGTYDAVGNAIVHLKVDRIAEWVAKGAVMSEAVAKIHRLYKIQAA